MDKYGEVLETDRTMGFFTDHSNLTCDNRRYKSNKSNDMNPMRLWEIKR